MDCVCLARGQPGGWEVVSRVPLLFRLYSGAWFVPGRFSLLALKVP